MNKAEKEAKEPTDSKQPEADAEPATRGGIGRGLTIAFIGTIILAETAMFFLMVPSAEEVSALAEQRLIQSIEDGKKEAEDVQTEKNKIQEYEMGMYGEIFSPHDTEATYRVELEMYGLIKKDNEDKMRKDFDSKQGRLRNAIRTRIRNSSLEELQENNLGLLERRILTQCNHLLDEDMLLGIGFKSYQLIEQ